jgi:hypothetical protein
VQENQVGLKLNETNQLLAYADDVNLLGGNIDTREKNSETLIDASQEVYIVISSPECSSKSGQKIANRSFENVLQFKYLGTTVTNLNLIEEEIKRRLSSGNACYHSVQSLLSSRLLSKNLKMRIYKINFACDFVLV